MVVAYSFVVWQEIIALSDKKIHDKLTWMIAFHAIDYSQTGRLCKYVIIWD